MYRNKTISLYLPCRNEEAHLQEIVATLPEIADEIIIVSNRSTDNTYEKALSLGVKALEENRTVKGIGYGFAHQAGMRVSSGEIIATGDGDGTYPLEILPKIIDHLLDHNLDFISCNRYPLQPGTKIPFKLKLGVYILNWEVRILYGIKIKDILSGMWIMRKEVRDKLDLKEGGWDLSPEVKIKAATHPDIRFSEYSIVEHRRLGTSKQNHWKTGFGHMWWIFKNRFTLK
jgi:glycosyltransferase involved in cell wall biosynthesis